MKVCHILNRPLGCRDANDIVTLRTCNAIAGNGHDVFLVVGRGKLDFNAEMGTPRQSALTIVQLPVLDRRVCGVRVCWNGCFPIACLLAILRLRQLGVRLVHTREIRVLRWLMPFKKILGMKVVFDVHELMGVDGRAGKRARLKAVESMVLDSADGVVVTTRALVDKLRESYGHHLAPVVVPLAASLPTVTGVATHADNRRFRVSYIGQLSRDRGIDVLLDAIKSVPDSELHLIGGSAERIDSFRRRAADIGIADRVVFYGFRNPSELPGLLARADVLVVPPKPVGRMPYVAHTKIYDCMQSGIPLIASDLPSIRETVTHEVNALLFEPGSSKSLAEAIKRLKRDPSLARTLGMRASADARAYTYERRAAALIEVFRSLLV